MEEETDNKERVLALETFSNAFRDVEYNSASLSAKVNGFRKRLANEQNTLTFEQRMDLSCKLKVWQYLADSVMRGGAEDHERVNSRFVGKAVVEEFEDVVMEVRPRGSVLE
mgnify:FL=1